MPENPKVSANVSPQSSAAKAGIYLEDLGLTVVAKEHKVAVDEVLINSDAAAKGIKNGDIIDKADGKAVESIEDLRSYAAYAAAAGRPMELTVISDGIPQTLILDENKNGAN